MNKIRVPRLTCGRPRTRPDSVSADKGYSNRRTRRYLRRRGIRHVIPEKRDQAAGRARRGSAGGRPPGFDKDRYKKRNTVERAINKLKTFRAVGEVDSGRPAGVSTQWVSPSRLPNPACPSPGTGLSTSPV